MGHFCDSTLVAFLCFLFLNPWTCNSFHCRRQLVFWEEDNSCSQTSANIREVSFLQGLAEDAWLCWHRLGMKQLLVAVIHYIRHTPDTHSLSYLWECSILRKLQLIHYLTNIAIAISNQAFVFACSPYFFPLNSLIFQVPRKNFHSVLHLPYTHPHLYS